jgi:hypothetical protein
MFRKYSLLILVTLLLILFYKKCGEDINLSPLPAERLKNEAYFHIPKSATVIASINLLNVLTELKFDTLRQTEKYITKLKSYAAQNPPFAAVFSDPVKCGVDITKKAVFFIDGGESKEEVYSASILNIKDAKLFNGLMATFKTLPSKKKKYYTITTIDAQSACAWNNNFVIFISTNPEYKKDKILAQCFDPTRAKYFDDHKDFLDQMQASQSDVSFWIDLTSYSRNQLHATGKPGEVNAALLKGNTIFGDLDFNNGAMDISSHFKANGIIKEFIAKLFDSTVDKEIEKYIPATNTSSIIKTSWNLQGLLNLIMENPKTKVAARSSLTEYGLVMDDFTKAFSGDVLFASYPNDTTSKSSTIFSLKIKDKVHFEKLIKVWKDIGKIEEEGVNIFKINSGGIIPLFPIHATYKDKQQRLILKENYLYVSPDKKIIDQIENSDGKTIFNAEFSSISGLNYISFFGDNKFSNIGKYVDPYSISNFTFGYGGDSIKLHLNFIDQNTSALKQILSIY